MFTTAKQIYNECERVLKDDLGGNDEGKEKIWSFREMLTWKMSEHLSSNSNAKNLNRAASRVHA